MSRKIYLYHPESDCFIHMTPAQWKKASQTADGGLCTQITKKEYLEGVKRQKSEETSDKKFRVSQSKVKTYRRCRQAYHNKYVLKLRKKTKSRPLVFGSLIHKMIELDAEGDDPFTALDISLADKSLFAVEKAEYSEVIEDVGAIMGEYFPYWEENSDMRYVRRKGRSAEHHFEIEILPDVIFNGKIDALGKTGLRNSTQLWMVEHKSFARKPNADDRWRNLQSVSYFRAMDIMGWPKVDGTCWDYVWSKAPRKPGLLASGAMSQKNIDTLPSAVELAIKEHGLDRSEYKGFIEKTKVHQKQWFQRIYTPVQESVSEMIFDDFVNTVKEMVENHGKKSDMNIERHCSWCDYEPLCRAKLEGLDVDYVMERQYEKSNRKEDEEAYIHKVSFDEIPEELKA